MPIDPQDLVRQIEAATPRLRAEFSDLDASVSEALSLYRVAEAAHWRETAQNSQIAYSLGYPLEELHQNNPVGDETGPYTVVATDGSPIPPDRHGGTALYHVLNIGRVMLRYGPDSRAEIDSKTLFYAGDVTDDEEQGSATGPILDLKMKLQELTEGLRLAEEYGADLVMVDGPLTLWNSRTQTDPQSQRMTDEYYELLSVFGRRQIPIVGYLSNPYGQGVTNSLRLLRDEQTQPGLFGPVAPAPAPRKTGNAKRRSRLNGLHGVVDALLFQELLLPDHYSETFKTAYSEPKELAEHIKAICFVYLKTENEVTRLEFPEWVAADPGWLPRLTVLVRDQSRRGQGYPVALMEAHESAVLRGGDRELLRVLLEERGLLQSESEKGRSKRLRGI